MVVYRTRSSRVFALIFAGVPLASAIGQFATDGTRAGVAALGVTAAAAGVGYAALWRPKVDVDDAAVTVHNTFRTVTVPYARLKAVDTRFALTLTDDTGRKVNSFAIPAPGPGAAGLVSEADLRSVPRSAVVGGAVRPGDVPSTVSGAAATAVRKHWQTYLTGLSDGEAKDATPVVRRLDHVGLASVLGGFAALAAVAIAL